VRVHEKGRSVDEQEIEKQSTELNRLRRRVAELEASSEEDRRTIETLQLAVEVSGSGIWQNTPGGSGNFFSDTMFSMLGYEPVPPAEGVAFFRALLHPDDRANLEQTMRALKWGEQNGYVLTFRLRTRNDDWRWILSTGHCVARDAQGQPARLVGTHIDITEQKQASTSLRDYARRLELWRQIDRAILTAQSRSEMAQVAVRQIRQLIPCQWASIVELGQEGECGRVLGFDIDGETDQPAAPCMAYAAEVFRESKARLVKDTSMISDPSPLILALRTHGVRSFINVPLMVGDTLIGCLGVGSDKSNAFTSDHLKVTYEAAALLAITIQNSQLIEAERRRSAELASANAFITVLGRVALHLQTNLELEQVINMLRDELAQLGISCFITLVNEEGKSLTPHFASVNHDANLIAKGVPKQLGLDLARELYPDIGQLLDHHQPVFIAEPMPGAIILGHELYAEDAERIVRLAGMTPASKVIGLPLVIANRLLGVLAIWGDDLHEEDLAAASLFASQVAVAIENARLLKTLREQRQRLRMLSARLLDAQEEERKRISEEIHHEMGQALTAIRIDLARLEHEGSDKLGSVGLDMLRESQSTVDQTLERMRDLALSLRPSILDTFGLIPALRWHLNNYARRVNIITKLDTNALAEEERFPSRIETAIYRIVQETLTNTARHAQASKVTVSLERQADTIVVSIKDNGRGFDEREVAQRGLQSSGMGLLTMRERVHALGGRFILRSRCGDGVQLRIEIPLESEGLTEQ
jgi:PAS domain S-box-containing protein